MCGRYATTVDPGRLAAELDAIDETGLPELATGPAAVANYNVAPTNQILTVVERHDRDHPDRDPRMRVRRMRWGLIPSWTAASEPGLPAKGKPLYNARAEKAAGTPSFRDAVKKRRCLVPMDGWYEWLTEAAGQGKAVKQPYYLSDADGRTLFMAGLWSVWRDPATPDRPPLLSCAILTTDAVGELTRVHDRMPLPMPREHWAAWLDPDHPAPASLLEPPAPQVVSSIVVRPVPMLVNSVRNNGPELLGRVDDQPGQLGLL